VALVPTTGATFRRGMRFHVPGEAGYERERKGGRDYRLLRILYIVLLGNYYLRLVYREKVH